MLKRQTSLTITIDPPTAKDVEQLRLLAAATGAQLASIVAARKARYEVRDLDDLARVMARLQDEIREGFFDSMRREFPTWAETMAGWAEAAGDEAPRSKR